MSMRFYYVLKLMMNIFCLSQTDLNEIEILEKNEYVVISELEFALTMVRKHFSRSQYGDVLSLRYGLMEGYGMTYAKLGERYGKSAERMRQVCEKSLRIVRRLSLFPKTRQLLLEGEENVKA